MATIKIKYFDDELTKIAPYKLGAWIDLRAAMDVELKKGEYKLIPLGVAMELPEGYEAHVVPRSSTYKNFKIIQANHTGIIDPSYCGDEDQWFYPVIAMEDTVIHKNDRICQFRLYKTMEQINFEEVNSLGNENRGGFGHSGIN